MSRQRSRTGSVVPSSQLPFPERVVRAVRLDGDGTEVAEEIAAEHARGGGEEGVTLAIGDFRLGALSGARLALALGDRGAAAHVSGLFLERNELGPAGVEALCRSLLSPGSAVRTLVLRHNAAGPEAGPAIGDVVSRLPTLRKLDVSRNNLGVAGSAPLWDALASGGASALEELYAAWNSLGPEGGVAAACALAAGACGALRVLDLEGNRIGEAAAPLVRAAAEHGPDMLLLGTNSIKAAHVERIVSGLRDNRRLVHLGMDSNRIGEARELARLSLSVRDPLKRIDLRYNADGVDAYRVLVLLEVKVHLIDVLADIVVRYLSDGDLHASA